MASLISIYTHCHFDARGGISEFCLGRVLDSAQQRHSEHVLHPEDVTYPIWPGDTSGGVA